jgi:hypothetical protein
MKTYELIFDESLGGWKKTSMVKDAAVEATLMKFANENNKPLFFANEEKRIIYSVALRPNKLIFRKNVSDVYGVEEPANVFYTEETATILLQNYYKNNYNKDSNINHEDNNTEGIYPFEAWQVIDPELDKSKAMGLETFKGDVVMAFKVDNDEVWEQVKEGNLDGLSIEAHLLHKESNFNTNTNMNKNEKNAESLWNVLKSFFSTEEQMAAESPEVASGFFADSLEVGSLVTDKEGNPAANASFEVDGVKYETDDKGAIMELVAEEEEMAEEEKPAGEETPDLAKENEDLKAKITELETELNKLKADKVKAETDLVKMAKEVMEHTKMSVEKTKDFAQMTPLEKFREVKKNINQ